MDRDKIIETAYEACLGYEVDIDAVADYVEEILIAELKKARQEVAKEIRADIWRENRNVHNRSADIVKAVFVKLEEIIDQNKVDEV